MTLKLNGMFNGSSLMLAVRHEQGLKVLDH